MNLSPSDWSDPANVQDWIRNNLRGGNQTRAEQIEILIELLAVLQSDGHRILDLGCGDGVVAELLLTRFPAAYVIGLDASAPMLDQARARLSRFHGRFTLLARDLRHLREPLVEAGSCDAAIGVQAVHHLNALEKQRLLQWINLSLRDGGLCLLADRIRLDSAPLFPYHLRLWDRIQRLSNAPVSSNGYTYAVHLARCAMRGDIPDTIEEQLAWMRAAGFGEVDIFFRHTERAVFGGLKAPRSYETPELPPVHEVAEMRGI